MGMLLLLIVGFFAFEALGYAFHRLLHSRWSGPLHRAHMAHHLEKYPPEDFLSETYRSVGTQSTTLRFAVFGLLVAAAIAWVLPIGIAAPLLVELTVVGAANAYVHDAVHVQPHWLGRFRFFGRWRLLHFQHHENMGVNYGVVSFWVDRVAGTYRG